LILTWPTNTMQAETCHFRQTIVMFAFRVSTHATQGLIKAVFMHE
jgi:hypothetical protein